MADTRPTPIDTRANSHHRSYSASSTITNAGTVNSTTSSTHSDPLTRTSTSTSLSKTPLVRLNSNTPSISSPISFDLSLTQPSVVEMWVLCRQMGYFYNFFIDTVTTPTLDSSRPKAMQKNLMYSMSERGLIIAREFATLTHHNVSYYDLGQRKLSTDWAICDTPSYDKLFCICKESSAEIFGSRLGNRIDHRDIYNPPHVPSSQTLSNLGQTGLQSDFHNVLQQSIQYNMDDWNQKVANYTMNFDPFRPLHAVRLMMETAKELSMSAKAVIRLIEHHYRLLLGLAPIEGVSDAQRAYDMSVQENNEDLETDIKREKDRIAMFIEAKLWLMRGDRRESALPVVDEGNFEE